MTRKSRGISGIESAIILIAIVLMASFLAYSVINSGSTGVGKVKTTIDWGTSSSSNTLQHSGSILGMMCLEGGTTCGEHSSLSYITIPIKNGPSGTPVQLDFSNTATKYVSNSVEFDDIYNGTIDVETPIVYVMDTNNNRVQTLDADGTFINQFGGGVGPFGSAFGMDATPSGIIYVADRLNNRIQVFDSSGNNGFAFTSPFPLNGPFGITYDTLTGNVIVADSGNNLIQIFDSSGNYLSQFPTGAFPFRVTSDGTFIYVAMGFIHSVEIYDFNGNLVNTLGTPFVPGAVLGEFTNPVGIEVTSNRIIVSDLSNRIQIFDLDGIPQFQFVSGAGPWEVDADSFGNIYVTANGIPQIEIYDSSGTFLSSFGSLGAGPGQFNFPAGIAVASYNGDPTTAVGIAAGRGIITTNIDSIYGPTASETSAWTFFSVSKSPYNSALEQGEHGVIAVALAPQDRPIQFDKVRVEVLTASGATFSISVNVPGGIQTIKELG